MAEDVVSVGYRGVALSQRPRAIASAALLLFVANVASRYPGEANADSNEQYAQVMAGHFVDWHPPIMAQFWSILTLIAPGTGPLFVVHIALYWAGVAIVAVSLARMRRAGSAWATLAVGALPPLLMMNINIAKDVGLAVAMIAAFAILFAVRTDGRRLSAAAVAAVVILLTYGTLVRSNAVFAVGPLLAYAFAARLVDRPAMLAGASLALAALLVPASAFINHRVLMAQDGGAIRSLQMFDLAGIAARSGDVGVFGPASDITETDVARCYTPIMWDTLGKGRCGSFLERLHIGFVPPEIEVRRPGVVGPALGRLQHLWVAGIAAHPLAYAAHRIESFNSATYFIVPAHHTDAVRVYATAGARSPSLANRMLDWLRYNTATAPAVMIALGAGLLAALFVARPVMDVQAYRGAMALGLSGVLYALCFLVIGVATDPRYFMYPTMAILIAAIIALSDPQLRHEARRHPRAFGSTALIVATVFIATALARLVLAPVAAPGT